MQLERRNFLRGQFKSSLDFLRPPHAIAEQEFLSTCQSCPDCVQACAENVIVIDQTGTPKMSFDQGECTFCGNCLTACTTGALDEAMARPWTVTALIGADCLSMNGVFCRTCGDNCDEQAIAFKLMVGGRSQPIVNGENCTGCGACAHMCPNKSIKMVDGQTKQQGKS